MDHPTDAAPTENVAPAPMNNAPIVLNPVNGPVVMIIDGRPLSGFSLSLNGDVEEIKAWLHRATFARNCRVKGYCRLCKFGDGEGGLTAVSTVLKYLLHDHYVKNSLGCGLGAECPMGCK
ncbi:hypothetical protein C1H76_2888 [Elsinoe australis]|uniref:Uncharacterized protein n=1 Tax=Elsinoe australis TaxID=40998 RepID=A0A4U7B5D3_9PEZI|nr:hypothetical protein C1H76_2888 [Elsinoe australis]